MAVAPPLNEVKRTIKACERARHAGDMETVARLSFRIKELQAACVHPDRNSGYYRKRDAVIVWCRECNGIIETRPVRKSSPVS